MNTRTHLNHCIEHLVLIVLRGEGDRRLAVVVSHREQLGELQIY